MHALNSGQWLLIASLKGFLSIILYFLYLITKEGDDRCHIYSPLAAMLDKVYIH